MRNGTLPARIWYELQRLPQPWVTVRALAAYGSPQAVSRAMRCLVREGRLEMVERGRYRVLDNQAPRLAFNRAWSNPGAELPADKLIAVTLARPTFRDVVRLCRSFGVAKVRSVLRALGMEGEIGQERWREWERHLDNIQRGFRDAAHGLPAH